MKEESLQQNAEELKKKKMHLRRLWGMKGVENLKVLEEAIYVQIKTAPDQQKTPKP